MASSVLILTWFVFSKMFVLFMLYCKLVRGWRWRDGALAGWAGQRSGGLHTRNLKMSHLLMSELHHAITVKIQTGTGTSTVPIPYHTVHTSTSTSTDSYTSQRRAGAALTNIRPADGHTE
jgi:hypothetical protein